MKKKKAKREYTPEQREAMRERMAHARASKHDARREQVMDKILTEDLSGGVEIPQTREPDGQAPAGDTRSIRVMATANSRSCDLPAQNNLPVPVLAEVDEKPCESESRPGAAGDSATNQALESTVTSRGGQNLSGAPDPPPNHSGLETQAPTFDPALYEDKPLMETPAESLEEMQGGDENATTSRDNSATVDATTPAPTSDPDSAGTPQEKAWPDYMPTADPTKKMKVTALPTNPRLAICSHPDHQGEQHVIVGNSENLIIGLEIPVIRDPAHPAYWLLAGPLPRTKGRW